MTDWQDIATAPRDGTRVDLSCVDPCGCVRVRLTDCSWTKWSDREGWSRVMDDGYLDWVESPAEKANQLPEWLPTHWMPLPEPPETKP